jgi:hypothetical protein
MSTEAPSSEQPTGQESSSPATSPAVIASPESPVVAKAGSYYRNVRYFMVLLIIGFGAWFLKDGYYSYPKENREFAAKPENRNEKGDLINKLPRSDLDINIQRILGWVLPPIGLAYFAFFMHRTRGTYRFDGTNISIPGHPDFTLDQVTRVDKRLWDRKGIAFIDYDTGSARGKVTLDDFLYDRKPTDIIYDAVIANIQTRAAAEAPQGQGEA